MKVEDQGHLKDFVIIFVLLGCFVDAIRWNNTVIARVSISSLLITIVVVLVVQFAQLGRGGSA
jgi:hypothetical protein